MSDDKHSTNWQQKLAQLDQQFLSQQTEDDVFSQNMNDEDLADLLKANRIMAQLDDIGIQKAPSQLNQKLYAIADEKPNSKAVTTKNHWMRWSAMASAAAVFLLAVLVSPWQNKQPSAEEIEQARNQLAMTFFYLNKAADLTRQQTQQTIANSVHTAMTSSQFLGSDEDEVSL